METILNNKELIIPKKRRGRKPSTKTYFEEKDMCETLSEYRKTNDPKLFNKLYDGFEKIINGMINTEFYLKYLCKEK